MKRVAGYGRVSGNEAAIKGTSVKDQRQSIKQECKRNGFKLYKLYFDEGITGKIMKARPGIQQLISDAKEKKFDIVMFTKFDRVARNLRELLNFWHEMEEKLQLKLYCIDDTSINTDGKLGKVMLHLLGMFAEFERELISERTGAGRKFKWKNQLAIIGALPYGYEWDSEKNKIKINLQLQKIYNRIVRLYIDLHYSMRDICNILSGDGVPTPSSSAKNWKTGKSKRWNNYTIQKILSSTAYKGEAVYNQFFHKESYGKNNDKYYTFADKNSPKPKEEWIAVKFPPMISEERWNLIQARREQQKLKPKKRHKGYENNFLADEVVFCGECGAKMRKRLKERKGKLELYYVCYWKGCGQKELDMNGRQRCRLKMVNSNYVDEEIFKSISQLLSNPFHFGKQWLKEHDIKDLKSEIKILQDLIKKLEEKIDNAYDLITETNNMNTKKRFKEKLREDESERDSLASKLNCKQTEFKNKSTSRSKLKDLQDFLKDTKFSAISDLPKSKKYDDFYETEFKQFLFDMPFQKKKQILSAVISPETGGKCFIRYKRLSDRLDPADFGKLSNKEWDEDEPIRDEEPIVDMRFSIDVERIKSIISGLVSDEFLNKFDTYGTAGRIQHSHRWRRVFR